MIDNQEQPSRMNLLDAARTDPVPARQGSQGTSREKVPTCFGASAVLRQKAVAEARLKTGHKNNLGTLALRRSGNLQKISISQAFAMKRETCNEKTTETLIRESFGAVSKREARLP
jgi:hypothetical protein